MADGNPYAQYKKANPYAHIGLPAGAVMIAPPDPVKAYDVPKAVADLAQSRASLDRSQVSIAADRAQLPYTADIARAQRDKAVAEVQTARTTAANAPRSVNFERADKLRADYEALPSVKNYTQALPVFGAGLQSRADAAGDLNLIYAYAKVMDPNSVVREGEQASVAGGDTWINAKVAQLQKQMGQGGTFKPEYRQRLREEMAGRMGELNQSFIADRVRYKGISDRFQVDPLDVVGEHPGERFQALSERVLHKPQQQLDYNGMPIASGPTRTERDDKTSALMDTLVRRGASLDEINSALTPLGMKPVEAAQYDAVKKYLAANPGYKGSLGDATREVAMTPLQRASASPVAGYFTGAANGLTAGFGDEIAGGINSAVTGKPLDQAIAEANKAKGAITNANPVSSFLGNVTGTGLGAFAGGAAARGLGVAQALGKAAPYYGSVALGALTGAGESNDNRVLGAGLGALAGAGGQVAGELAAKGIGAVARTAPGLAATNRLKGLFGGQSAQAVAAPSAADQLAASTLSKVGIPQVQQQLDEARGLGLPFSLADTHPELRELAGSAVRKSPTAASYAENAYLPRSRGQIDRFGQAVERDLGPIANIPQVSADMTAQARAVAAPKYDLAYSKPVISTPELDATLSTPFGRSALSRANTIAANERRSPMELGFAQDAQGNTLLNPRPNQAIAGHLSARDELDAAQDAYRASSGTAERAAAGDRVQRARQGLRDAERALSAAPDPSLPANVPGYTTQSLDYVKRGMDDVLEQHRNPITGRLQLDEAGRAQNEVKNQFLKELDILNPAYKDARATYAGPVQARDAMARGQDALTMNPNELGMQVANQSPEHLAQMQLGYRSGLMDTADKVRYSSNPFDATLGTPAAEQRLGLLYPDSPGVPNLLRTRDMERTMANTSNSVLGNSKTAQRQIADESFLERPAIQAGIDIGANAMAGGIPVSTMLRAAAGGGLKDAFKMGVGKRAVAKADELAPILMNPDPAAASVDVSRLFNSAEAYRAFVEATTPKRLGGMFGRAIGISSAGQASR